MRLIILLLFLSTCNSSECTDEKACTVFKEQLELINKGINKEEVDVGKVNTAIIFLEDITSINSTTTGNFLGRFNATKDDYIKWQNWFEENKQKLIFDEQDKKVKLKD